MSERPPRWEDLPARTLTGAALAAGGLVALIAGGPILAVVTAALAGVMLWELVRLLAPEKGGRALGLSLLGAVSVLYLGVVFPFWPVLLLPIAIGTVWVSTGQLTYFLYSPVILVGAAGILMLRETVGLTAVFFVVLVVAATDIAGYFLGRRLGGPKFWPRISPKKTWAGTIAGWVAAALVAVVFVALGSSWVTIPAAVFLSLASQFGDIAESSIKRRAGVKDSSAILPGHGGLLDRFDGMIGALTATAVASLVPGLLPGMH